MDRRQQRPDIIPMDFEEDERSNDETFRGTLPIPADVPPDMAKGTAFRNVSTEELKEKDLDCCPDNLNESSKKKARLDPVVVHDFQAILVFSSMHTVRDSVARMSIRDGRPSPAASVAARPLRQKAKPIAAKKGKKRASVTTPRMACPVPTQNVKPSLQQPGPAAGKMPARAESPMTDANDWEGVGGNYEKAEDPIEIADLMQDESIEVETRKETTGTCLLYQVLRENKHEEPCREILKRVKETIRAEFPTADLETIFVTNQDIYWPMDEERLATHALDDKLPPTLGVVDPSCLIAALQEYRKQWMNRIPFRVSERRAWVMDIEDSFCARQCLYPGVETDAVEKVRLAIQFLKKWLGNETEALATGVTTQMIMGHLKLLHKAWQKVQEGPTRPSFPRKPPHSAVARPLADSTRKPMPWPRARFEGKLPTTPESRLKFVGLLKEAFHLWKETSLVAPKMRPNLLLAFEKLLFHTEDWLKMKTPNPKTTERTVTMFLGLLQERWLEFLDKTDLYTPILLMNEERSNDNLRMDESDEVEDAKTDDQGIDHNSSRAVASYGFMHESKPLAEGTLPLRSVQFKDVECEDDEFSQVSIPFDRWIDENPLYSDATKGLFFGIEQGDMNRVQHFIANGATVKGLDEFGDTPGHRAAEYGHVGILQHLRLHGCDIYLRNATGELPAHLACAFGHLEASEFLVRLMRSDKSLSYESLVDNRGRTLLHDAALHGHVNIARLLFNHFGAARILNVTDHDNLTARHYALLGGYMDMVSFLDEKGASMDSFDPTNLHQACATGRLGLVQWLVESQYLDWQAKDARGRTPLDCALQAGQTHVAQWIQESLALGSRVTNGI